MADQSERPEPDHAEDPRKTEVSDQQPEEAPDEQVPGESGERWVSVISVPPGLTLSDAAFAKATGPVFSSTDCACALAVPVVTSGNAASAVTVTNIANRLMSPTASALPGWSGLAACERSATTLHRLPQLAKPKRDFPTNSPEWSSAEVHRPGRSHTRGNN